MLKLNYYYQNEEDNKNNNYFNYFSYDIRWFIGTSNCMTTIEGYKMAYLY